MNDKIKAFWLGIFIIITVAVAAWLLLFLRPNVGDCGKVLKVYFSNIQGVSVGTRVTFGGKPVGEVVKIQEIADARAEPPDPSGNFYLYELNLCVDSSVEVFSYDEIIFSTAGLLGEKSIAILPKAAPAGMPPAQNITDKILYARSTDELQETLTKLTDVAEVFESAMERFNEFLDENIDEFHRTVISVGEAATSLNALVLDINNNELVAKISLAADNLSQAMASADETLSQISRGEGSLGRLLTSDHFYLQMTAVMCKLETVLTDIDNYGLLFQYDRKWQRKRLCKEKAMQQMCTTQQALIFFNSQVSEICNNLDRVQRLLCRIPPDGDQEACFDAGYRELLGRVESLLLNLKQYREMLFNQYCETCH